MASTNVGSIHYDLSLDTSKFDQAAQNIGNKMQSIGSKMSSVGQKMTVGLTLPIVAGFGLAVKAASDFNETLNKIDVAFKDQASNVKKWAQTSITSMGLAKGTALDAAALFGDMSTAMGLNTEEAAKMSTGLVQLGADMASFKNVSFERAQTALAGIYTGETEALKGLGIVMTEANLQAYAQAQGIDKTISSMTQAEKVQLRYGYVMSVTKNAQGDFARTSEGTANQIRITKERFKELSAEVGQKFLPVVNKVLAFAQKIIEGFGKLTNKQQNMILAFIGLAAVIGPVLTIGGYFITLLGLIAAHPVVAAVVLLAAGIAYLHKRFGILNPVIEFFKYHMEGAKTVLGHIQVAFMAVWNFIAANFMPTLRFLVDLFVTWFLPSLTALWNSITTQLFPALETLWTAFMRLYNALQPGLTEALKVVGIIIGVMLVAYIWVVINVWNVLIGVLSFVIDVISRVIGWISNIIGWLGTAVMAVVHFAQAFWQKIIEFKNAWDSAYQGVVRTVSGIIGQIVSLKNGIVNTINGVIGTVYNAGRNIVSSLANGIRSGASWVMSGISAVSDGIGRFFGGAVNWLWDSGRAIVIGLVNGLKSAASWPVNAVKDIVANVRSYLPFSPAKKGPFSGKGWTTYSGQSMMKGLSDGIKSMGALPQKAMSDALTNASMGPTNQTNQTMIYGNVNIGDTNTADYFLNRINRGQDLAGMGIAA